jgi:bacteriorhodopsin
MSVQEISMLYNALFIVILIVVCGFFSLVHLMIRDLLKWNYWIITTGLFVLISFSTILIWYNTIGFIT